MVEGYIVYALAAAITGGILGIYLKREIRRREELTEKKLWIGWTAGVLAIALAACLLKEYEYSFWKMERYIVLMSAMPVLSRTDRKEKKIPNRILGVLCIIFLLLLIGEITEYPSLWKAFIIHAGTGAIGSLFLMLAAYYISRRAIGMGDVKLLTVTGLYLGFSLNYVMLLCSLLFAAGYSLWNILKKRMKPRDEIAFAPFIATGVWLVILLGF